MEHFLSVVAPSRPSHRGIAAKASAIATVLIVEDEALIRLNAVQMVEDAGYTALEASNAEDAFGILQRCRDIRAVFTDVRMAGSANGLKLAHFIYRRWPPIRLIVTSGLSIDFELPPGSRFVPKPYENSRVVGLLNELFAVA